MQRRIALILGVVLALSAVFMVKAYLDQQSQAIKKQAWEELSERKKMEATVVVAIQDIAKGTTIEKEMLETKVLPRQFVQPQAATSPERIIGMVVLAPISKDEQITFSKLITSQQAMGSSLAMATPVGKRAIMISVDNISSLMGMLRPQDYVDVIALLPVPAQDAEGNQVTQMAVMPLFQNIQVLTVGQELGQLKSSSRYASKEKSSGPPTVTLALTPQEANLISFVQEQGKIRLTLRSPADSRIEAVQPASWDALFQYLMPQAQQAPEQVETEKKEVRTIEIYRGLSKEEMPLSQ